jgi:GNAT superfamily N-acetyltransferase
MIYELQPPGSHVLVLDCTYPEAGAVIAGNNPGWVFVDDLETPRAALVWAQGIQGFYLLGDPESTLFLEDLDAHIDRVLKPRLQNLGVAWFEVSGGKNWDAAIENTFRKRNLERSQQWVYTLEPNRGLGASNPAIVGDSRLLKIDRHLFADLPANKAQFLQTRLELFWGSLNAFLKAGLGYVLLCGDEIASLCYSGFVWGDTHAIDIETLAIYRRKGYAKAVAQAFIAECVELKLHPYWDCMAENVASLQLAEKLGFTKMHTYTLYAFPL